MDGSGKDSINWGDKNSGGSMVKVYAAKPDDRSSRFRVHSKREEQIPAAKWLLTTTCLHTLKIRAHYLV